MAKILRAGDPSTLSETVKALRDGGAVVLPTDTVYGVGTLPAHTDLLYALKGRPASVPIAVLVASLEQARSIVTVSPAAERLSVAFWPGPLTIVLPATDEDRTIGVRCPADEFVLALVRETGPLAVTSANRHGDPTPADAPAAAAALVGEVALVVDGGHRPGSASTVVDATSDQLAVLREGPISPEQVKAAALR
jgi:L-threonylcarbamoyladenylate synthase